ncbi:A-kinase anchor protein 13 [Chanos chanos]|uniref:A-kinase anchor protein 13 n=1 Tax=Chanos chanos TaxID=29144 RepID=A0A6J2WE36_CHACN|nr:A-kinase anchor protein 13-like [Chanos chanos]
MKLNPQQAPLYGECVLTVQLDNEECLEDEEEVEFYLLFAGTTQTHLTSTHRLSHVTLQAVCPAHNCSETVQVTLCLARPGGPVDPLAEECFQYVQDLALDMAQFLVSASGHADGLEGALLLDECQIPLQECERLDHTLALALRHLSLPQGWSVLGTDFANTDEGTQPTPAFGFGVVEPGPHETLLHFAARRGLRKVALFLLQQPGAREALKLPNKQGRTPASIAQKRGHTQLHKLLTEVETLPEIELKAAKRSYPGGRALRHHPRLNTYTLTVDTVPGSPLPSLQKHVEELQHLIRCHQDNKEDQLMQQQQQQSVELNPITDNTDSPSIALRNLSDLSRLILPCTEQQSSRVKQGKNGEPSSAELLLDGSCVKHGQWDSPNSEANHAKLEEGEEGPARGAVEVSEKASDKSDSEQWLAEGEPTAFSSPSCGNQQEETDRASGVICAKREPATELDKGNQERQRADSRRPQTETNDKTQSGNTVRTDMGHVQSQGLLPTEAESHVLKGETERRMSGNDIQGDLPEERQGERASSQEMNSNLTTPQPASLSPAEDCRHDIGELGQTEVSANATMMGPNQGEMEIKANASQQNEEIAAIFLSGDEPCCVLEPQTGNLCKQTNGSIDSVCNVATSDESLNQNHSLGGSETDPLDSVSLRPNMAKGPRHHSQSNLEPSSESTSSEITIVDILNENSNDLVQQQHKDNSTEAMLESVEDRSASSANDDKEKPVHAYDVTIEKGTQTSHNKGKPVESASDSLVQDSHPLEGKIGEESSSESLDSEETMWTEEADKNKTTDEMLPSPETSTGSGVSPEGAQETSSASTCTASNEETAVEAISVDKMLPQALPNEECKRNEEQGPLKDQKMEEVVESEIQDTQRPPSPTCENLTPTEEVSEGSAVQESPHHKEDYNLTSEEVITDVSETRDSFGNDLKALSQGHADECEELLTDSENKMSEAVGDFVNRMVTELPSDSCSEERTDKKPIDSQHIDEVSSSSVNSVDESCTSEAPVKSLEATSETAVSDSPSSSLDTASDSALGLELTSLSDNHNGSIQCEDFPSSQDVDSTSVLDSDLTSSMDVDRSLTPDLGLSSSVDVNSFLSPEMQPSDTLEDLNGLCEDNLNSERTKTEERNIEEPNAKTVSDEPSPATGDAVVEQQHSLTEITDAVEIHREKDSFCPVDSCPDAQVQEAKASPASSDFPPSPSPESLGRSVSTSQRDSTSDVDVLLVPDAGDDSVFKKGEDSATLTGDSTSGVSVSCSSTDDTGSLGLPSTPPSAAPKANAEREAQRGDGRPTSTAARETEEEERKDRLTEVPVRSALMRSSIRSLSPFRRHSWGPSKNAAGEAEMNQRSTVQSQEGGRPAGHRRSMSWCPAKASCPEPDEMNGRSYSLEGLSADREVGKAQVSRGGESMQEPGRAVRQESEERGSLVSLTEEEHEWDLGDCSSMDSQKSAGAHPGRRDRPPTHQLLTKSVSMLAISQKDLDGLSSFSGTSGSVEYSISEEDPGPLRSDSEGRTGGTKVSRTFSYLRSKMSKKNKEKDKEKNKDKERDAKEKEKRASNGHLFSAVTVAPGGPCHQCNKPINTKDAFMCTNCNSQVHKGCRENLPVCAKVKMKQQRQQQSVPDFSPVPSVTMRSKTIPARERPWSTVSIPDEQPAPLVPLGPRRSTGLIFNSNLSKSVSISNIAGPLFDEMPLKVPKYLSQSTDSLHKTSKVNESTESLTDEGTEMMDSQLMGEFEADAKELEADSWSFTVDKKYLKQLKKDVVKRQDVIYELIQTEMHHVRTLKIMSDVYSKGLLKEVQLEAQTVERVFPMMDDLLDLHTHFFSRMLERKREASSQSCGEGGFIIRKIGDVLVSQFSESNAERMKKVYGKFCSRHSEAVNFYKELHTKDKRFQAFIKKKMSSTIVRRLSIPECILLVTQRITKYPVLLQRILEHTKDNEEDHKDLALALRLVKELIAGVDNKVNEYEKKRRLKEVYSRTDSKSIMRMKSGQMFAREDLIRGRKLIHDGPLQLKNSAGRLKDVQAMLLSDVFVFLQEKDQKYVFASLDQRSTVISLQKLIVREVANEERGLFLITAGSEKPEMVEVHASSKEERNTWMQLLQDAMHLMEKDDDEGIPSETEEDKRLQESKAKELRDQLHKKDEQILALLEEKVKLFRDLCHCGTPEEGSPTGLRSRMLFRATPDDITKGEPIMKDALKEVETLQELVSGSLGRAVGQQVCPAGDSSSVSVCLPRRAETFGGFDSHQMSMVKNGDKEETEDPADLRRTESDSMLKKGGNANLLLLLKRNSEQVLQGVTRLHDLLNVLQGVVIQQDTFIEDQRQALSERPPSRHPSVSSSTSSSSSFSSSSSSRPNSLIEQEKQRSLEKQRQEAASLQRQQAAHAEERRRREREWEAKERGLAEKEARVREQQDETQKGFRLLEEEKQELQRRKEEYQRDLARLRDSQKKLERDREQLQREVEQLRHTEEQTQRMYRTSSTTSEDSLKFQSSGSLDRDPSEVELSSSPLTKEFMFRKASKHKGKNLNPFSASSSSSASGPCDPQGTEAQSQIPNRLLQLAKPKDKKDKRKKKNKGQQSQAADKQSTVVPGPTTDGEIFFC